MKLTFLIIFFSILSIGLSQSNKKSVSQKDFFDQSIIVDTIADTLYYAKRNIGTIEFNHRIYSPFNNDTLSWYIQRNIFRKDGALKTIITYTLDSITETGYDKKANISYQYTSFYEFKNPAKRFLILNENRRVRSQMELYRKNHYSNGKIIVKGTFHNYIGRVGTWEFFDRKTGEVKRVKKYVNGKKVSDEKIISE